MGHRNCEVFGAAAVRSEPDFASHKDSNTHQLLIFFASNVDTRPSVSAAFIQPVIIISPRSQPQASFKNGFCKEEEGCSGGLVGQDFLPRSDRLKTPNFSRTSLVLKSQFQNHSSYCHRFDKPRRESERLTFTKASATAWWTRGVRDLPSSSGV